MTAVVSKYLNLLDFQRESTFTALEGLTDSQLWQRPAPKAWSIGEILDHNYLLFASFLPIVQWIWKLGGWYGRLRRNRPYKTEIEDLYRDPKFPHWVGFLWTPRYSTRKPVSLEMLKSETRDLHAKIREFYEGKDEDILGNLYLYDPVFGWCNLIVTLRIGIYHDQLHYDDVTKQATQFKR
ncbi:MAG TPA: DinB family protein [Anaerolineales bacterium]|nr:DinB family protein [Anaerolineales bacterium]